MEKKILFPLWVLTFTAALALGSLSGASTQGGGVIKLGILAIFTAQVVDIDKENRVLTFRELDGSVIALNVGGRGRKFRPDRGW